jgi:hypothetical protein
MPRDLVPAEQGLPVSIQHSLFLGPFPKSARSHEPNKRHGAKAALFIRGSVLVVANNRRPQAGCADADN